MASVAILAGVIAVIGPIPGNRPPAIDLLLPLRVGDAANRDGLNFGNEVLKQNASFFGDASTAANIAQVSSNDPVLDIAKGVIGSSNVNVVGFDNPLVAPIGVSWLAPGATAVSPGFSGTVTTAGLTNGAPDADVVGADAGDLVRFAIVVENTGAGVNGAFDVAIDDMFPDGFVIPGAGIRLLVTDGAGNALANTAGGAFVAVPGTGGMRNGTITLTDGVTGSLAAGRTGTTASATGTNIAVITYELEVAGDALPNNFYENTTVLSGFSATSGGANLSSSLPAASTTNQASVTTAPVDMVKTVLASDQPLTTGNRITVGEVISYQLVLTIPEGTTRQLQVVDDLDVGQAMLSVDSITATPVLASTTGFATALANARATLAAPGSTMTIEFGDVTNGDRDNTTPETITVVYRAILLNVATNTIDLTKNNVATAYYIATPDGSTAMDSITVVEPVMVTDKSATPATADANDTITYVIDVRHTNVISDAVAFDVSTVDVIPAGLTYVPGSVHTSGGAAKAPTSLTTDGTTITATWALLKLAPFEFGRITYQATLNPETAAPLSITNTSTSTWTSVPGAGATTPYSTDDTERTGVDGVGGLNDFSSSDSATVTVSNPQIVKSLFATNDATTTGNNMTIGETGTYQLLVTLPEASIAGFQISDALPAGLRVIGTPSVLTAAAASGGQLPADFNGTLGTQTFSTTTVATRDTLVLDVGASSMVDDNVTTNNSFLVRFDGIVADVAGNVGFIPGATVLSNIAGVQITGGSLVTSNAITVNVVEPRLNLVKTFSPNNAAPGSTVSVTITVQNAGLSPGQESVLSDSLDARFDATTVAATSTPTGWTFARAGTTLTWSANAGVAHAAGTTLTFDFTVQLLSTNVAGAPIPNTASAITSTRAGVATGERDEPARAGSAILGVVTPDLNVTKTDGVNTAIPGATLSFVVVTSNTGGAIARNVTLTDLPAAGTTYVGVTGPCTLNGSSTATVKVFDLGSIANAASVSCTLTVTVDNPAPAGTTGYVNSVAVADDGTNGADPTPANNSSTDSDTIVANPDLGVTKDDGVSERTPGAAVAYVVTVTNTGNIGATNILVTDTVPSGFVFGSCTRDVGYFSTSCTSSGGVVSTSVAVIAGGNGTARITIIGNIVNPAPAGLNTVTNTVRVIDDGANGMDPTSANNIATDADAIVAAPDLVISKSSVTSTVEPGGSVGYTITATNVGTQDATDVVVSDSLPAGLSAVCGSETPAAATCTNSGFTWTAGAFPVGRFTTYNYTLHAADPMPAGTHTLTNTATVADDGDNGLDPTPANNAATVAVSLVGTHVDLAVTKTDNVTQAAPGATLTYAITVVDNGNIGASGVQVTDTVPLGTTFASAPDTGHGAGVNTGDVVVWDIATVPAGVPVTLTLVVVVDRLAEPGMEQLVNTVAVEDDAFSGTDPTPGDNSAVDIDLLIASPDLVVTNTDGRTTVRPGDTLSYTVAVTNAGAQESTGVVAVDTMPGGTELLSVSGAGNATAGVITWPSTSLAAGATITHTVTVRVALPYTLPVLVLHDVATVADDHLGGPDPTPDNNYASDADIVDNTLDLSITNDNSSSTTAAGTYTTWQIIVTNRGPADVGHFTVVDSLPSQVSDAGYRASTGTYDPVTGVWNGPAVAIGGTVTLAVTALVAPDATGTLVNTATVAPLDGLVDPEPADNSAIDSDALVAVPGISITKTAAASTTVLGASMLYTITLTNAGPSTTTTNVSINDVMPIGLSLQQAVQTEGWNCSAAVIDMVDCDLDRSLRSGESTTFQVHTTTLVVGDIRNVATVTSFSGGDRVSSSAVADISVSAPVPAAPLPAGPIPFTGADVGRMLLSAVALLAAGALMLMMVWRRRPAR